MMTLVQGNVPEILPKKLLGGLEKDLMQQSGLKQILEFVKEDSKIGVPVILSNTTLSDSGSKPINLSVSTTPATSSVCVSLFSDLFFSPVAIRYEAQNFLTRPFEMGVRHLKVAFAKKDALIQLAKERVIYRPGTGSKFDSLTWKDRAKHLTLGLLETAGYLCLASFVVAIAERILCPPPYGPFYLPMDQVKGRDPQLVEHLEEGGSESDYASAKRSNPFKSNEDPFYKA